MQLDAELGKIGSFPSDQTSSINVSSSDFHSELIASATKYSDRRHFAPETERALASDVGTNSAGRTESQSASDLDSHVTGNEGTAVVESTADSAAEADDAAAEAAAVLLPSKSKTGNVPENSPSHALIVQNAVGHGAESLQPADDPNRDNISTADLQGLPSGVAKNGSADEPETTSSVTSDSIPANCEEPIDMVRELDVCQPPTPSSSTPLDASRPFATGIVPPSSLARQNLQNFVCDDSTIAHGRCASTSS